MSLFSSSSSDIFDTLLAYGCIDLEIKEFIQLLVAKKISIAWSSQPLTLAHELAETLAKESGMEFNKNFAFQKDAGIYSDLAIPRISMFPPTSDTASFVDFLSAMTSRFYKEKSGEVQKTILSKNLFFVVSFDERSKLNFISEISFKDQNIFAMEIFVKKEMISFTGQLPSFSDIRISAWTKKG